MADPIASIKRLLTAVQTAGKEALESQSETERDFKADGSVVTGADKALDEALFNVIHRLYPAANILTEEAARPFEPERPYTFAVDPIDGTDVYSQGMAGWCVSVALLDDSLTPIAGIIYAPRLDVLLFADVGRPATLNGKAITPPEAASELVAQANVMVTSRLHRHVNVCQLPAKLRSIGSAALHLSFPLIYSVVFGTVEGPGGHVWDIAGAHAILRSHGMGFELLGGGDVDYTNMVRGGVVGDVMLAGHRSNIDALRGALREEA